MHTSTGTTIRHAPRPAAATVVDSWYAEAIGAGINKGLAVGSSTPGVGSVDEQISRLAPWAAGAARRLAGLRGLLWFLATRKSERIVCTMSSRGLVVFILLQCVLGKGRRRVFLVEFLRPEPAGPVGRIKEALHDLFFRVVFPRTLAGAQVMTRWEVDKYAAKYRLPRSVFSFIPFPMMLNPSTVPARAGTSGVKVLASGRAACDWPVLFAAARGAAWELTVICSREDLAGVERLNADGRATVLCEVSESRHQQLLLEADVYALVLKEQDASSGQVRLARAIEAGIPVVASNVRGLDGYLHHGVTGMAVAPGDIAALRSAIDGLIGNLPAQQALRTDAYEAMRPRTLAAFIQQIKIFCLCDASRLPAG